MKLDFDMHNLEVGQNISALANDVENAGSQDDLLALINKVKHHPGPLDYRFRHWWILVGFLTVCGLLAGYAFFTVLAYSMGFYSLPLAGAQLEPWLLPLQLSGHWAPALLVAGIAFWNSEQGRPFQVFSSFSAAWQGPLLAGCVVLALTFIPQWQYFYWVGLQTLAAWISPFDSLSGYGDPGSALTLMMLIAAGWLAYTLRRQANWRDRLSDRISERDALFNNGLTEMDINGTQEAASLLKRFQDFRRGNDDRKVMKLFHGYFDGEQQGFAYRVCQYRYSVRTSSTYTNSNGDLRTRTTTKTYYRHSLLTTLNKSAWVGISADSKKRFDGVKYKSDDTSFNRQFRCWAESAQQAEEFFTQKMQQLLLEIAAQTDKPVLEILSDGSLCLSLNNDVLALERRNNLEDPDAFAKEIAAHNELQTLNDILRLIERLRLLQGIDLSGELE